MPGSIHDLSHDEPRRKTFTSRVDRVYGERSKQLGRTLKISYDRIRQIVPAQMRKEGTTSADAYARHRLPKVVNGGGNKYTLLEEPIMERFHSDKLYGEIADELKIDIHRVSDVVRSGTAIAACRFPMAGTAGSV
jgi:hypothetical protein